MLKLLSGLTAILLLLGQAQAQQQVTTNPSAVSSLSAAGSIAVTSTFQSVFAAAGQVAGAGARVRQGCLIQNTGSNVMYVFVGPIASATTAASFVLTPAGSTAMGGSFSCSTGTGGVIQDQISVTGTSTDTFAAASQ